MKLSEARTADLAKIYIQLRDRRAQRKAKYDAEDADDKAKQERIEADLLRRFNEEGIESVRTEFGTAYKTTRRSATVADWDALLNTYIIPNKAWEMLEHRASKTAVEQYRDANNALPPGINWSETVVVNVKRS